MKTITLYTAQELKELDSDAYDKAYQEFRDSQDEIPWTSEIVDSFKAIFKASGITLRDYKIGPYCYSYVRFDIEQEVKDLEGNRALAWLENNLLGDLRIKFTPFARIDKEHYIIYARVILSKYGQYYRAEMIKPCPFTGYYADDEFIESLLKEVKQGMSLGDAYSNLANEARKMFESECEYQASEENFLEHNYQYTENGIRVY